ncbi:hypothetical protein F4861DRAFT_501202 [Xylaria intraflava]|nr:hypothetical protein F4861DRAFT_501202 [Xylaria intraflava]
MGCSGEGVETCEGMDTASPSLRRGEAQFRGGGKGSRPDRGHRVCFVEKIETGFSVHFRPMPHYFRSGHRFCGWQYQQLPVVYSVPQFPHLCIYNMLTGWPEAVEADVGAAIGAGWLALGLRVCMDLPVITCVRPVALLSGHRVWELSIVRHLDEDSDSTFKPRGDQHIPTWLVSRESGWCASLRASANSMCVFCRRLIQRGAEV